MIVYNLDSRHQSKYNCRQVTTFQKHHPGKKMREEKKTPRKFNISLKSNLSNIPRPHRLIERLLKALNVLFSLHDIEMIADALVKVDLGLREVVPLAQILAAPLILGAV